MPSEAISCLACQSENGVRVEKCAARDVVGMLLGDLLDVDPAHVGEQHHRALADPVPDDAGVVLVRDIGARVDQHAAGHVAVDLELEHVLGMSGGLVGGVGELHAAGLHPPAGQHLRLDHHRAGDLLGDRPRLLGRRRKPVLGDGDPRLGHDRPRLVLEETHRRRGSLPSPSSRCAELRPSNLHGNSIRIRPSESN